MKLDSKNSLTVFVAMMIICFFSANTFAQTDSREIFNADIIKFDGKSYSLLPFNVVAKEIGSRNIGNNNSLYIGMTVAFLAHIQFLILPDAYNKQVLTVPLASTPQNYSEILRQKILITDQLDYPSRFKNRLELNFWKLFNLNPFDNALTDFFDQAEQVALDNLRKQNGTIFNAMNVNGCLAKISAISSGIFRGDCLFVVRGEIRTYNGVQSNPTEMPFRLAVDEIHYLRKIRNFEGDPPSTSELVEFLIAVGGKLILRK